MINLLKKYLKRVNFSQPASTDIIIFDETNAKMIETVIPEGFSFAIFNMRPIQFCITPRILLNFVRNLTQLKFTNHSVLKRGKFYGIIFQLYCIYIKANLLSRNPKAIITFIDNCSKFAWLSENYKMAPCIAIQNGFRLSHDANFVNQYYCEHLFCFGEREVIDFPKLNYQVDNFYPVGSLGLSINFNQHLVGLKPVYDLLVVSCWRGNIGFTQDVQDSMRAMRQMDEMLSKYLLAQQDLKAAVILRSERDSDQWFMPEVGMSEEDYFRSIYGDSIQIIETNFAERNVYPVMQSSDTIVAGFASTSLIEAHAMGKKILYANFSGTEKYHIDFKPEIVFHGGENSYKLFEIRLNLLRMASSQDYLRSHKDIMSYYIKTPNYGSTRKAIELKINDIIESAKV